LALLGHVILGIFAKVTVGAGSLDLFGQLVVQLMLERLDFLFQLFLDVLRHRGFSKFWMLRGGPAAQRLDYTAQALRASPSNSARKDEMTLPSATGFYRKSRILFTL
jgi:hypothetical protein